MNCKEAKRIFNGVRAAPQNTREKRLAKAAMKEHKAKCRKCSKDGAVGG